MKIARQFFHLNAFLLAITLLLFVGCASQSPVSRVSAKGSTYVPADRSVEGVTGIGFESQDIKAMTDQMVRDIMATPRFSNAVAPPRIIIDDKRFVNESNQIINLNILLDRLRIELMRAAQDKIVFVAREHVDLVQQEKELKGSGQVDPGGREWEQAISGADYRLVGRITSQSTASNTSGIRSNYYQFSFELLDLNTGQAVWGNLYDIRKAGADDTIYR